MLAEVEREVDLGISVRVYQEYFLKSHLNVKGGLTESNRLQKHLGRSVMNQLMMQNFAITSWHELACVVHVFVVESTTTS